MSKTRNTHLWISIWFVVSAAVMASDCSYLFLRPRSLPGGDLYWLYETVYGTYSQVDKSYGLEVYELGEGFPNAQALLNAIESMLGLFYLYLRHIANSPSAPVLATMVSAMTLGKTVLFFSLDYYCNWCTTGHNDPMTTFTLWFLPGLPWIILPALILFTYGGELTLAVRTSDSRMSKID